MRLPTEAAAAKDSAPAPVLLDIARLIWSARRTAPSGIDRVELAYAEHFLDATAGRPAYAVIHLMGWLFGVSPAGARRFVKEVAARWQGGTLQGNKTGRSGIIRLYSTLLSGHWMVGFHLRWRLRQHREPPIFLVVSHHHLSLDYTMRGIRRYFAARCVCFLHDLIPIDYPEYVKPNRQLRHRRATQTITRFFDAVIVNSKATADSFRQFVSAEFGPGMRVPSISIALPGVCPFPRPDGEAKLPDGPDSVPYFVVLGTIEPKKNHLLLLNLWSRLATSMATPPRLLVIGARGWENEQVVDMLERSHRLRGLVEEHNHLDDVAVGSLLCRARALLVPSFVEGFGLPLAEALASGVPVICSDISAFREVGRDVPDYLDPLDLFAWRDAIVDYSRPDSARRAAQMQRLAHWQPPRWSDHFEIVERTLDAAAELSSPSP
jgi:glycosyltransferase involved in cell wall biosynthesis